MRVVALVSGGKDSCYNMMQCVAAGHTIVALANLEPVGKDELDSYMYQTVGHQGIGLYAEALGLPLFRQPIRGEAVETGRGYNPSPADEVEDLYQLLHTVKKQIEVDAVSVGAILSDYQRVRVENVSMRLGLVPLAYLWRRDQTELLQEMINCNVNAIIIKVAALGLEPNAHLGKTLAEMQPHLLKMKEKYGINVCGEGGEYETFTLDCPLFRKAIVVDEVETVLHSDDAIAPVGYLNFKRLCLVDKQIGDGTPFIERLGGVPVQMPLDFISDVDGCDDTDPGEDDDDEERRGSGDADKPLPVLPLMEPLQRENGTLPPHLSVHQTSSGWCWVGGVMGLNSDPAIAMKSALADVNGLLGRLGLPLSSLVAVGLYLRNLSDYAVVNAEYSRHFGNDPPVRVCVEAPLPENVSVLVEATAFKASGEDSAESMDRELRQTMHVQGVSHWAPANIGPYSQAVRVGDIIYVAGQIALVPGTMQLIEGGIKRQCRLALRHVGRIVHAIDPKTQLRDVVHGMCFVTDPSYIPEARREWERRTNNAIVDYCVVPALPRGALVEWHIWAHRHNSQFEYEETGCNIGDEVRVSIRRRLNYENNVAVVVCHMVSGSTDSDCKITEEDLCEVLNYAMKKLLHETAQETPCQLRVFYRVGALRPMLVNTALLQTAANYRISYTIIPVCHLLSERTLLSICAMRLP